MLYIYIYIYIYIPLSAHEFFLSLFLSLSLARALSLSAREQAPGARHLCLAPRLRRQQQQYRKSVPWYICYLKSP